MDDKLVRAKVHTAVQQHCTTSGVQPNPYLAQRVLAAARDEGVPVVKKKLSLGLVFILILLLTGTVALAATLLWQDYVPQMKQTEHEMGDYVEWPATRRIQLAKDIVAMGYLDESEDTLILSSETATEQDKAAAADRLMLKLTGKDEVEEIHSNIITFAIMGPEDYWTPEQRVWWNEITNLYADTGAPDTLIVPAKNDLSEDEAVAIAYEAVQEVYGFSDEEMQRLHPVANMYVTDQRPDYKRWDIQFKRYREGSSTYVENVYSVIVDEHGEVIGDPDVGMPHIREARERAMQAEAMRLAQLEQRPESVKLYDEYSKKYGNSIFGAWPVEAKAAWSQKGAPVVQRDIDLGWLVPYDSEEASIPNNRALYSITYVYGIPTENDLTEAEALDIAYATIMAAYGYDADDFRWIYPFYDITNPDKPLWRFVFYPAYKKAEPDIPFARVEMDAATGEVLMHETFERYEDHRDYENYIKQY